MFWYIQQGFSGIIVEMVYLLTEDKMMFLYVQLALYLTLLSLVALYLCYFIKHLNDCFCYITNTCFKLSFDLGNCANEWCLQHYFEKLLKCKRFMLIKKIENYQIKIKSNFSNHFYFIT